MDVVYLPFDSDLFGIKVGQLRLGDNIPLPSEVNASLQAAERNGYKLVYIKYNVAHALQVDDLPAAVYEDVKVTFGINLHPTLMVEGNTDGIKPLEQAGTQHADQLLHLAFVSGEYSRFKLDPLFPTDAFSKLYTIWLEKSLNKQIADVVYVFEENGQILGFVTVSFQADNARIGLIAVDAAAQGKGIGKKLIQMVIKQAKAHNLHTVLVDTQMANSGACSFYSKTGFSIVSKEYILDCWL